MDRRYVSSYLQVISRSFPSVLSVLIVSSLLREIGGFVKYLTPIATSGRRAEGRNTGRETSPMPNGTQVWPIHVPLPKGRAVIAK